MYTFSQIELLFLSALLGLLIGSFISMLSWRLPRILELSGYQQLQTISVSRSECPKCHTSLPWYRLFPVFSWLFSRGKCHHCNVSISARYPLIELTTALVTTYIVFHFGQSIETIYALIFSWMLITTVIIDLEHQLILDKLSLPLLWLGLLINTQGTFTTPSEAIWGAVSGYLILWLLFHSFKLATGKEGMGYGDFKLLAAFGAWFGILALPQIILIASLSSIIIMLTLGILKIRDMKEPIPFGPFLALGGWSCLLFGSDLIQSI